jgi:vacuolar-type H+-ATPase subunit H
MESNGRYWARRAIEELRAEARALTPEARARRRALAEAFADKARSCGQGASFEIA